MFYCFIVTHTVQLYYATTIASRRPSDEKPFRFPPRFGNTITRVCRPIKGHLKRPEINQDYVRESTATLSNIYYTVETHNTTAAVHRTLFEAVFTWSKRDYVKLVQTQ